MAFRVGTKLFALEKCNECAWRRVGWGNLEGSSTMRGVGRLDVAQNPDSTSGR